MLRLQLKAQVRTAGLGLVRSTGHPCRVFSTREARTLCIFLFSFLQLEYHYE